MNKIYAIKNLDAQAMVSSTGGTVMSFVVGDKEIFFPWRTIGDKDRGGCPICAPWFGSSWMAEKKHGHLRELRAKHCIFTDSSVAFHFRRFIKKDNYPYAISYIARSSLVTENELKMMVVLEREKDGIPSLAPILPGFHPYFACSDANQVEVIMGGEKYSGFDIASKMVPVKSRMITIKMPGQEIEMLLGTAFKEGQSQLVFWTDSPQEYVCVEPILQDKKFFTSEGGYYLEEDEELSLHVSFRVFR